MNIYAPITDFLHPPALHQYYCYRAPGFSHEQASRAAFADLHALPGLSARLSRLWDESRSALSRGATGPQGGRAEAYQRSRDLINDICALAAPVINPHLMPLWLLWPDEARHEVSRIVQGYLLARKHAAHPTALTLFEGGVG